MKLYNYVLGLFIKVILENVNVFFSELKKFNVKIKFAKLGNYKKQALEVDKQFDKIKLAEELYLNEKFCA